MGVTTEVRLDFISHAEEADAELSSFTAWLYAEPELSGAPVVRSGGSGHEVSSLVVVVAAGHHLVSLARVLVTWMNTRRGDVTVKLSISGKTVEVSSGTRAADIDRFLSSLVSSTSLDATEIPSSIHVHGDLVGRDLIRVTAGASSLPGPDDSRHPRDLAGNEPLVPDEPDEANASTMPITIYLSDERIHEQVEAALEDLLAVAGLQIESRDDPIVGSWFRQMLATAKQVTRSPAAREATLVAAHVADTRLVLAQDAAVTATLLQNLGPVLGALQPTKDAVIRAGALLIVKVDWAVNVFQLTAAQQAQLDHRPQLAHSPHEIIAALNLMPQDHQGDGTQALE
jgi:hypothetical protein